MISEHVIYDHIKVMNAIYRPATSTTTSRPVKDDQRSMSPEQVVANENKPRPDTAAVLITEKMKSRVLERDTIPTVSISQPHTARENNHNKKEIKSLMQYGREETTLLEVHKSIVEQKRYPLQIEELKEAIEPLMASETGLFTRIALLLHNN